MWTQETWVWSLGVGDPSSICAWRIPWTEEPGILQSLGSQESDTTERLAQQHVWIECISS